MRPWLDQRDHGIAEHGEVGPAADAIDWIGCVRIAFVETRRDGRREVTAGRKSHDADAIAGNVPFAGSRAHGADRALRVAELDRVVIAGPEPVSQHECRHPHRVEIVRRLTPFQIHRQALVAAAGRDDDRRQWPGRIRRHVNGERGLVGLVLPESAGRAGGPQENRLRLLEHRRGGCRRLAGRNRTTDYQ